MKDKELFKNLDKVNRNIKLTRQEVMIGTFDTAIFSSMVVILSIVISILIAIYPSSSNSPNLLLILFIGAMFIYFFLQLTLGWLNAMIFEENKFTNKINIITIFFSFLLFLILLIPLPYILTKCFPTIIFNNGVPLFILAIVVYGCPILFGIIIHTKVRNFFLNKYPLLFLEKIEKMTKENRKKALKKLDISYKDLKILANK